MSGGHTIKLVDTTPYLVNTAPIIRVLPKSPFLGVAGGVAGCV